MAERFGQKGVSGIKISVPLTHQDIGDILSLTRETVSTSMVQLRKKNLIKTNKSILVPNIEALRDEAYR
jgi:CRP-like cAMP-binding protein